MGLSGAIYRGGLSEAMTRRVGPPRPKEHKVPGTFRPNRPRQKVLVSGVRACDGNGLVLCEGGTREARTTHGFVGVGTLDEITTPRPPPPHCQAPSLRDSIGAQCQEAYGSKG